MKEKYRKCLKCGESPSDNARVILHRFPKPGRTNKLRCEAWAKFCFPDGEWDLPEFHKKLFTEHRMLCNKHFRMSSFMDISRRRLIKTATPDPESEKIFNETKNLNASVSGEVSKPLLHNTTLLSIDESSKELDLQKLKDSENGNSIRETVIKEPPSKKIRNETKNNIISVSKVTENQEPTQNIPQVSKKIEPTQNIPQVSKKIEPTQIIPQVSKRIEPTQIVPQVSKKIEPTQIIPQVSKKIEQTRNIPQVSKKIKPTQNIPQVSKKEEPTQNVPQVSKKKEPTQNAPQVSKPLLYNTTFLNTEESEGLELRKSNDSENVYSIYRETDKEEPSKLPSEYNRSLYIKCKKQSNKIKQLRNIIRELKEKLHACKISTGPVLKNKLKKFKIKSNTCEWDMNTKIVALKLYKRSQSYYNLLRKIICLPDPSTLRSLLNKFN
ncbi:uncharacterized protein LOC123700212 [Colias croceus]|uniref:uncharacterized protein LOC123700212 n=1 Tax=Colias crocea TaxID=72248 RepID=UPI001E27D86B|nr:uncharacterized protein LOC123700212 [Colias croceus]